MIIEDEQDILSLYKDFLIRKGHHVVASSTFAEKALDDYINLRPDVVLIDYKLPGKNGLDASKEILKEDGKARILILSAYENLREKIEKEEFFQDKNISFFIKPLRLARLEEVLFKIYSFEPRTI